MCVKSKKKKSHIEHLARVFAILWKFKTKLNLTNCEFGVSSGQFLGNVVSKWGIELYLTQVKNLKKEKEPRTVKDVQSLIHKIITLHQFIPHIFEKCKRFFKVIKKAKEVEWGNDHKKALQHIKEYLNSTVELSIREQVEELYMYMGQSESVIRGVLFREKNGKQKPMLYISRILEDVEQRYGPL